MLDLACVLFFALLWISIQAWGVRPYLRYRSRRAPFDVADELARAARIAIGTAPPEPGSVERSVSLRFDRSGSPLIVYAVAHHADDGGVHVIADHVCFCDACRRDHPRRDVAKAFTRVVDLVHRTIASLAASRPDPRPVVRLRGRHVPLNPDDN